MNSKGEMERIYYDTYMASYVGNKCFAVVCCGSLDGRQTLPASDGTW